MPLRQLTILGSTGSIGRNVLRIVARHGDRFAVRALTAHSSVALLAEQVDRFRPDVAVVIDDVAAEQLKALLPPDIPTEVLYGPAGYITAAEMPAVDTVVAAMVGAAGLKPTLAAIEAGKTIALANKETLVMAGETVMARAAAKDVEIRPIDSEHSAIYQCLSGNHPADLKKILLTGSGGPFRTLAPVEFNNITKAQALKHPNWSMGPKITVDSATMMNKGLEVIEARWLFGVPPERIQVLIHPQSIVHSMVAFTDGSVIAQMGAPDMRAAIAYALSGPRRLDIGVPAPDFIDLAHLNFEAPDLQKFQCLALAYDAIAAGGTLPAVLNAANEIAVDAFLNDRIAFTFIPELNQRVMAAHSIDNRPTIEQIMAADQWARKRALQEIEHPHKGSG